MNTERKRSYFQELTFNLQYEGFTVRPETWDGLLPVDLDDQRLCVVMDSGAVRCGKETIDDDHRNEALDRVVDIARLTAEYMKQMKTAPRLTASGLTGDYRLLADFNNVVLAGHPTRYGVQFITWDRIQNRTALHQGDYFGPNTGIDSYLAAKRDFATRSGLIPRSALFSQEQLAEMYRSVCETLENDPITEERLKCLESAVEQIQRGVPDLETRVEQSRQKEAELAEMESPQDGGIRFS